MDKEEKIMWLSGVTQRMKLLSSTRQLFDFHTEQEHAVTVEAMEEYLKLLREKSAGGRGAVVRDVNRPELAQAMLPVRMEERGEE